MVNLIKVINELKAPKNQYNSFGKYNYRNIEDIMEAAKPLLYANGLKVTFYDVTKTVKIDGVENTVIISTAICKDSNGMVVDKATGIAGVENRKGMDLAQSFGSSTSYARKYAVGSLFNLDDTKDSDSMPKPTKSAKPTLTENSEQYLKAIQYIKKGGSMDDIEAKYTVSESVKKSIAIKLAQ